MIRGLIYSVLSAILGIIICAFVIAFSYPNEADVEKIGAEASKFYLPLFGGVGFLVGWMRSKRKKGEPTGGAKSTLKHYFAGGAILLIALVVAMVSADLYIFIKAKREDFSSGAVFLLSFLFTSGLLTACWIKLRSPRRTSI